MMHRNTIIKAWLLAGSLDIIAACVQYRLRTGGAPANVLRFVASGVFGSKAFSGGAEMVVAGLLFHYGIAGAFTFFFFWIAPKIALFNRSWILTGVLYGLAVWLVMNGIVLPLSRTPPLALTPANAIQATLILVCCIGLSLSFMYFRSRQNRITVV